MIEEIRRLKEERLIRQISPIYDTKMAGYDSSLVAFRVPEGRLEEVARLINLHPGVSHSYEREHEFNLWFTIAVPPDGRLSLEETVSIMADLGRVEEYLILRMVKTYKIGVKLDYKDLTEREEVKPYDLVIGTVERLFILWELKMLEVSRDRLIEEVKCVIGKALRGDCGCGGGI